MNQQQSDDQIWFIYKEMFRKVSKINRLLDNYRAVKEIMAVADNK